MSTYQLELGRRVRYFAGYGGTDGVGTIVNIRGVPNTAPRQTFLGGVVRVIQDGDCSVDVVLDDGRQLLGMSQCGIDCPGIGISTLPEVVGPDAVEAAKQAAADYEAQQLLARVQAQHAFEQREASRVITDPPLFYWNGIKDHKGAKLQRVIYSGSSLRSYPEGTITIYARDHDSFSSKVMNCFAVENNSDIMVDYFETSHIRVIPSHPLYPQVKAALEKSEQRFKARMAKRA